MKIFVTVGTTKFPKLVDAITQKNIVEVLRSLGVSSVQIQTGRYFEKVFLDPELKDSLKITDHGCTIVKFECGLTIKYDQYFENFEEQIKKADLIISHAGAGSCLDVLRQNKPLIVVINTDLMNNHQIELAEQLQNNGHLYYCTCESLAETLKKDFSKLKPYPKPDANLFSSHLDRYCGFLD